MPVASCDARPCAPHRVYGCFMCIGRNRGAGKRDPGVSCVTSTEKGGARLRNPVVSKLVLPPPCTCNRVVARVQVLGGGRILLTILQYCCVPRSAGCVTQQCRLCLGIAAVQAAPANGWHRLCRRHEEHTAAHHASRNTGWTIPVGAIFAIRHYAILARTTVVNCNIMAYRLCTPAPLPLTCLTRGRVAQAC